MRGNGLVGIALIEVFRCPHPLGIAGYIHVPRERHRKYIGTLRGCATEKVQHFYGWNPRDRLFFIGAGDPEKQWASGCVHVPLADLEDGVKMAELEQMLREELGVGMLFSAHVLRVDATRLEYLPFAAPELYGDIARSDVYAPQPEIRHSARLI